MSNKSMIKSRRKISTNLSNSMKKNFKSYLLLDSSFQIFSSPYWLFLQRKIRLVFYNSCTHMYQITCRIISRIKTSDMDFISYVIFSIPSSIRESKSMPMYMSPNFVNTVSVPTFKLGIVLFLGSESLWNKFQFKKQMKIWFTNG